MIEVTKVAVRLSTIQSVSQNDMYKHADVNTGMCIRLDKKGVQLVKIHKAVSDITGTHN